MLSFLFVTSHKYPTTNKLLFATNLLVEVFHRIKMPIVLGELLAGIIAGSFALGSLPFFDGKPLVRTLEIADYHFNCQDTLKLSFYDRNDNYLSVPSSICLFILPLDDKPP
jgi:Kef-type K+ transport system membrane component KefB